MRFAKDPDGTEGIWVSTGDKKPEDSLARAMVVQACLSDEPGRHLEFQLHRLQACLAAEGEEERIDSVAYGIIDEYLEATPEPPGMDWDDVNDWQVQPRHQPAVVHVKRLFDFLLAGYRFYLSGNPSRAGDWLYTEAGKICGILGDMPTRMPWPAGHRKVLMELVERAMTLPPAHLPRKVSHAQLVSTLFGSSAWFAPPASELRQLLEDLLSLPQTTPAIARTARELVLGFHGRVVPDGAAADKAASPVDPCPNATAGSDHWLKLVLAWPDLSSAEVAEVLEELLTGARAGTGKDDKRAAWGDPTTYLKDRVQDWEPGLRGRMLALLENRLQLELETLRERALAEGIPPSRLPEEPRPADSKRESEASLNLSDMCKQDMRLTAMALMSTRSGLGVDPTQGQTDPELDQLARASSDPLGLLPTGGQPLDKTWERVLQGLEVPAALTPERRSRLYELALDTQALQPRQRLDAITLLAGCLRFFPTPGQVTLLRQALLDIGIEMATAAEAGAPDAAPAPASSKDEKSTPAAGAEKLDAVPREADDLLAVRRAQEGLHQRQLASAGLRLRADRFDARPRASTQAGDVDTALAAVVRDRAAIEARLEGTTAGAAQDLVRHCLTLVTTVEQILRAAQADLAA